MRGKQVNQETVTTLAGWVLVIMLIWLALHTLTQVARSFATIAMLRRVMRERRLNKIEDKFHEEQQRIFDEVEPKFEFWWSNTGKKMVEGNPDILELFGLPFNAEHMPEQVQQMIMGPALMAIEENAQQFAWLLASAGAHRRFIDEMKQFDRAYAEKASAKHEKNVSLHRTQLLELGIDVDEFEREFSAA